MQNNNSFVLISKNSIGQFYRKSIRNIETIFCLKKKKNDTI